MNLSTGLLISEEIRHIEFAQCLFGAMQLRAPEYLPYVYGECEPVRTRFILDNLAAIVSTAWRTSFYWRSKTNNAHGMLDFGYPSRHSKLHISNQTMPINAELLTSLFKAIGSNVAVDIGYIHYATHAEFEESYHSYNEYNTGLISLRLHRGIPGPAWGMVYGKRYTSLIGERRLLASPAFRVEKWPGKSIYIQLTEDINQIDADYAEFKKTRDRVRTHIGQEFFLPPKLGDYDPVVPDFEFK